MLIVVIVAIVIALLFDFLNGMNDAANSIATIVSTRVLSPTAAVFWAAFWNFAAFFIFGVHVANTMGKGIVHPNFINPYVILSALIGAVLWVYTCSRLGMPISVSHSLIGGLIGPILFKYGPSALVATGIFKIGMFIVLAPLIGATFGFIMMAITLKFFKKKHPLKVEKTFHILQLFSSAVFSIGHGGNDAQKTMGIIAILLFSVSGTNEFISTYLYQPGIGFHVPLWLTITCYSVIGLGTLAGGRKVMKTLGDGLAKLKPVQGFCAETAGAITLIGTSLIGIPVSTTHTITGAIIGVGMTKGVATVKWATAKNVVSAWIFTIPLTLVISGLIYLLISNLLGL